MITIFGIPNCDKCRAARQWFVKQGIEHQFHDLRKDGLTRTLVAEWLAKLGQQALINKRSKTWREIAADVPDGATDAQMADILLTHPTLIKRPLVDGRGTVLVGYDEQQWQALAS